MSKLNKVEKSIEKNKESDLIKFAQERDKEVQLAAIAGMGKIGKDDSFNFLISILTVHDTDLLIAAATALGQIQNAHASAHLHHLLDHTDNEAVKKAVVDALAMLPKNRL